MSDSKAFIVYSIVIPTENSVEIFINEGESVDWKRMNLCQTWDRAELQQIEVEGEGRGMNNRNIWSNTIWVLIFDNVCCRVGVNTTHDNHVWLESSCRCAFIRNRGRIALNSVKRILRVSFDILNPRCCASARHYQHTTWLLWTSHTQAKYFFQSWDLNFQGLVCNPTWIRLMAWNHNIVSWSRGDICLSVVHSA